MFYEEQVIGGVLHSRSTPDGEWTPVSAEALTRRVLELEADRAALRAEAKYAREEPDEKE